jgi:hypothetical protein
MLLDGVVVWDVGENVTVVKGWLLSDDGTMSLQGFTNYEQTTTVVTIDSDGNYVYNNKMPLPLNWYPEDCDYYSRYPYRLSMPGTIDWGDGTTETYYSGYVGGVNGSPSFYTHTYSAEYVAQNTQAEGVWVEIKVYCDAPFVSTNFPFCDSDYKRTLKLQSLTLADCIEYVYDRTFLYSDMADVQEYGIPSSMKILTNVANRSNVDNLVVPPTVVAVGLAELYCGCSEEELCYGSFRDYYEVFENCGALTNVTFKGAVKLIGRCAFNSCTALESITIPNTVECIGSYAFNYCHKLVPPEIPNSVKYIHTAAFYQTGYELYEGVDDPDMSGNNYYLDAPRDNYLHIVQYRRMALDLYVIPDSVEYIGGYAFDFTSCRTVSISNQTKYLTANFFMGVGSVNDVFYRGTTSEWFSRVHFLDRTGHSTCSTYEELYATCSISDKKYYQDEAGNINRYICDDGIIVNPYASGRLSDGTDVSTTDYGDNCFDSDGKAIPSKFLILRD